MKRVVTIQDISCFGKCSITVALPIISAMGVECAIIPTAVLSTHTAGFKGYTFRDLSEDIDNIANHWKNENLKFDGVYTGYLASPAQAKQIEEFTETFKPDMLFVDPVMADNGKLYPGFTEEIVDAMINLCKKANVIVPNITEACFILDEEYKTAGEYDKTYVESILKRLADLGPETVILTGVMYDGVNMGAVAYNKTSGEFTEYYSEYLPMQCHGTGDVFSSSLFGAITLGKNMYDSLKIAVDYTVDCMKHTIGDKDHWYGVKFEECIPNLVKML